MLSYCNKHFEKYFKRVRISCVPPWWSGEFDCAELSVFHSATVTRNSSAWIPRISHLYFFMYVVTNEIFKKCSRVCFCFVFPLSVYFFVCFVQWVRFSVNYLYWANVFSLQIHERVQLIRVNNERGGKIEIVLNNTGWSKSVCAPDDYSTKNTQKYSILNGTHSECGPCYTEHGLREHITVCQ